MYLFDFPDTNQITGARVASFELAFRMQMEAPSVLDLSRESEATRKLYGIDEKETDNFGRQCLMARRLVEAGVRFVQITDGGWDHHAKLREALPGRCRAVDKLIAGLITDLKSRGLLEDTLLIWGGEFGRTPFDQDLSQGKAPASERGREHNPRGFTMFLAGGGVKPGIAHGATDDFGWDAVEGKVHIHDLHATMLHLLGVDHERLTYRHTGRDYRLTDVFGRVVREVLGNAKWQRFELGRQPFLENRFRHLNVQPKAILQVYRERHWRANVHAHRLCSARLAAPCSALVILNYRRLQYHIQC